MSAPTKHLDLLQIDAVRVGVGDKADLEHLETCNECRRALADLQGLTRALQESHGPALKVPDEIERRILWNARKQAAIAKKLHVSNRGRRMLVARWAVAAGVVLALGTLSTWRLLRERTVSRRMATSTPVAKEDVDGDGKVDILDAFALARSLRVGSGAKPTWDLNGDGVVDGRDVDVIAHTAVSVGKV